MARSFSLFLCLLLFATTALSEQNVNPGINTYYENPDVTQWRGVFEREGREIWDRRSDIVRQLRLTQGQAVADIGAGTGFFTLLMAQEVGATGKVYAVDIARNFVDAAVQRASDAGLTTVTGVVNDQHSVKLPPHSIDLAFISDTYHHFEFPKSTVRSIHTALKPGGEMVIIDFIRDSEVSSSWVRNHVRAGEREVIKEIEAEGFELIEDLDFLQTQFYLRFRKKED